MKRALPLEFSKKTQSAWCFQALLLILGAGSAALLWYFDEQTLGLSSLQTLWQSAFAPRHAWENFLWFLDLNITGAVWLMGFLSCVSLCLFAAIALHLGLSQKTTFTLFLLINFNPEYNDVRLSVDVFQLVIPLWLAGWLAWLKCERGWGLLVWSACVWLGAYFEPATCLLVLFGSWYLAYLERGTLQQSALWYGLLMTFAVLMVWRNLFFILQLLEEVLGWEGIVSEHLLQFNEHTIMYLSALEGYCLALALVVVNGLACAGLLLVGLLVFGVMSGARHQMPSVLLLKIQRFLWLGVGLWTLMLALLLYRGQMLSDLAYMPLVMMILLLRANVVFYGLQRLRGLTDIQRLVLFWLVVSYGLASMVSFGPSAGYLREAGQSSKAVQPMSVRVLSNNRQVLFYAGRSPLDDGADYVADFMPSVLPTSSRHLMLYHHHRKALLPKSWGEYQVWDTFQNRHGDRVYVLHYQPQ